MSKHAFSTAAPDPQATAVPMGLPAGFIALGIASGLILFVGTAASLPTFADSPFDPHLLSLVHFFTLAWGSAVTIGVLHQMAPVLLATKLKSKAFGWGALATYAPGSLLLAASFYRFYLPGVIAGAVLVLLGTALFAVNLWRTWRDSTDPGLTGRFLPLCVGAFVLTVTMGFSMAMVMQMGWAGRSFGSLLGIHLFMGGAGWFTGVIIGVSYRLVPMFILSHGHDERLGHAVLAALYAGVGLGVVGAVTRGEWWLASGGALVAASVLVYAWDLSRLWKKRLRRPDVWLGQFPWAVAYLLSAALGGVALEVASALGVRVPAHAVLAVGILFALGWVGTAILALLHKIVPFLVWYHRYSPMVGKRSVPQMKDLVDEKRGRIGFYVYHAALVDLCGTLALGEVGMARVAAIGLAVAYVVLVSDLAALLVRAGEPACLRRLRSNLRCRLQGTDEGIIQS